MLQPVAAFAVSGESVAWTGGSTGAPDFWCAAGDYVEQAGHRVSSDLLGHLILAWGTISKRTFMRLEANEQVAVVKGKVSMWTDEQQEEGGE